MRKVLIVVLVLAFGGVFAFKLLAPSSEPRAHAKIDGDVYVLPKAFLINLAEHRYAKLSVALILAHGEATTESAQGGEAGAAAPPEGYGTHPQEALVRSIITDVLSAQPAARLLQAPRRTRLKRRILRALERRSDVHVSGVLFTDLAVQ